MAGSLPVILSSLGRIGLGRPGETLMDLLEREGVELDGPCGGAGVCGRCRVSVEEEGGLEGPTAAEEGLGEGVRLACQARLRAKGAVRLGALSQGRGIWPLEDRARLRWPLEPLARGLGLALDVGTTSLVASLVDLVAGRELYRHGAMNPQRRRGQDVISRLAHAAQGGASGLTDQVRRGVAGLVRSLLPPGGEVSDLVVVGNPAMVHLLFGLPVDALGVAPYRAHTLEAIEAAAEDVGIVAAPGARVRALPAMGPFVGADMVAGALAVGLGEGDLPALMMDLGTNGELLLVTDKGLWAASCAAGPALEGMGLTWGMAARPGAIVGVGESLELEVWGGGEPLGLAGSGALDLVARLLDRGVLDRTGRLVGHLEGSMAQGDGGRSVILSAPIELNQRDIRQIQLALGALRAGMEALLRQGGLGWGELRRLVVAGEMGRHIRLSTLRALRVVPEGMDIEVVGNAALDGAVEVLLSLGAMRAAAQLACRARTVILGGLEEYQDLLMDNLRW